MSTSTTMPFITNPFDMAYDSPLNLPPPFPEMKEDVKNTTPVSVDGYDWADGTTTTDPAAWEYWVWYKYNDGTGRTYYYSPHYDISQYEVPEREGPADAYEDIVIRDQGLEIWQKHYRGIAEFPHSEPYYYNAVTGQIRLDMPITGYVQVVRHYESIDYKGIRRNYTSVQFPRPPPVLVHSQC